MPEIHIRRTQQLCFYTAVTVKHFVGLGAKHPQGSAFKGNDLIQRTQKQYQIT